MLTHYLSVALPNFRKAPIAALANVAVLALMRRAEGSEWLGGRAESMAGRAAQPLFVGLGAEC